MQLATPNTKVTFLITAWAQCNSHLLWVSSGKTVEMAFHNAYSKSETMLVTAGSMWLKKKILDESKNGFVIDRALPRHEDKQQYNLFVVPWIKKK